MCQVFVAPAELTPVVNEAVLSETGYLGTKVAFESSGLHLEMVDVWLLHILYCSGANEVQPLPLAASGFQTKLLLSQACILHQN